MPWKSKSVFFPLLNSPTPKMQWTVILFFSFRLLQSSMSPQASFLPVASLQTKNYDYTHNRSTRSRSRNGRHNGQDPVPKEVVAWIQQSISVREDLTMPNFTEEFGYYLSHNAHRAFLNAMNCSIVPRTLRNPVLERYKIWLCNLGNAFWESRSAMSQIDISTNKAVK